MEILNKVISLDRLSLNDREFRETRFEAEQELWRQVEARLDGITASDMKEARFIQTRQMRKVRRTRK